MTKLWLLRILQRPKLNLFNKKAKLRSLQLRML